MNILTQTIPPSLQARAHRLLMRTYPEQPDDRIFAMIPAAADDIQENGGTDDEILARWFDER